MTNLKQFLWEGLSDETVETTEKVVDGGIPGDPNSHAILVEVISERLLDGGVP